MTSKVYNLRKRNKNINYLDYDSDLDNEDIKEEINNSDDTFTMIDKFKINRDYIQLCKSKEIPFIKENKNDIEILSNTLIITLNTFIGSFSISYNLLCNTLSNSKVIDKYLEWYCDKLIIYEHWIIKLKEIIQIPKLNFKFNNKNNFCGKLEKVLYKRKQIYLKTLENLKDD